MSCHGAGKKWRRCHNCIGAREDPARPSGKAGHERRHCAASQMHDDPVATSQGQRAGQIFYDEAPSAIDLQENCIDQPARSD